MADAPSEFLEKDNGIINLNKISDMSINQFKVGVIDCIYYVPNVISTSIGDTLIECIERDNDWTQLKSRKLKSFQSNGDIQVFVQLHRSG
jgi:hypothetical protein